MDDFVIALEQVNSPELVWKVSSLDYHLFIALFSFLTFVVIML